MVSLPLALDTASSGAAVLDWKDRGIQPAIIEAQFSGLPCYFMSMRGWVPAPAICIVICHGIDRFLHCILTS